MSKTYGVNLRFVAFEVKIGDYWLKVPAAAEVVTALGLDFVPYADIPTDLDAIDAERDRDSEQAIKNGMGPGHRREGIVLRPHVEVVLNNDRRVMAKHKREEFTERQTIPDIDPSKREMLEAADAIADEWVTDMRLNHVLDAIAEQRGGPVRWDMSDTGDVIRTMVEDVCREAAGEIADSKAARKAIGHRAATMFKRRVSLVAVSAD